MPRESRERGGQVHKRGLSREQICVMTGVNDSGDAFLDMAGRGSLSTSRALESLRGKVRAGAVVATDKSGAYPSALRELSAAAHLAYDSKNRAEGTINHVNALHSSTPISLGCSILVTTSPRSRGRMSERPRKGSRDSSRARRGRSWTFPPKPARAD